MNDSEILALALINFRGATGDKPPPDCGRWQAWANKIRKDMVGFTSSTEVLRYAQNPIEIPYTHRREFNAGLTGSCSTIIAHEYPTLADKVRGMSDDPRSTLETLGRFEGTETVISDMFYWHTWAILTCQKYVPEIRSVIEIGGGYGAVARLWCLAFPVDRYVIVDLPESLYFAEVCLRSAGLDVGYFEDIPPNTNIILVPVARLGVYTDKADLVINIGSMQEMNDQWIDYYMKWLDVCGAKYFYSLNYAAQPIDELKESRCAWGPRPSTQWNTKILSLDPAIIRIMCFNRHFLEALYVREKPQGVLDTWSVFRGRSLTAATYVEGLDLVRQKPIVPDIELFMETVLKYQDELGFMPKELGHLANFTGCPASQTVREYVAGMTQQLVA